jgi:hypothetical protein
MCLTPGLIQIFLSLTYTFTSGCDIEEIILGASPSLGASIMPQIAFRASNPEYGSGQYDRPVNTSHASLKQSHSIFKVCNGRSSKAEGVTSTQGMERV